MTKTWSDLAVYYVTSMDRDEVWVCGYSPWSPYTCTICGFHNYDLKIFLFHHYNNGILKWLYFLTKVAIWCDENFFSLRNLDGKLFLYVQDKTFLQGVTIRHMKNNAYFFTKTTICPDFSSKMAKNQKTIFPFLGLCEINFRAHIQKVLLLGYVGTSLEFKYNCIPKSVA